MSTAPALTAVLTSSHQLRSTIERSLSVALLNPESELLPGHIEQIMHIATRIAVTAESMLDSPQIAEIPRTDDVDDGPEQMLLEEFSDAMHGMVAEDTAAHLAGFSKEEHEQYHRSDTPKPGQMIDTEG